MRTTLAGLLLVGVLHAAPATPDAVLPRLASWLTGTFSNEAQARADSNFHNVVLHVVPMWPDRTDGPWLYLEQALSQAPSEPFRQQIYQLALNPGGSIEIRVFTPPDPIALTGAWKDPKRFASLVPDRLVACPGCSLQLKLQADGSFKGATEGCNCPSELGDAAYATTDLTAAPDDLTVWDRGFTSSGRQVWGPAFGGYEFKRVE